MARLYGMDQLAAGDVCDRIASLDRWLMLDAEVIDLEAAHIRLASLFVRRLELGLRIPDAIHIAVSQRMGATLATLDVRLACCATSR